MVHPGDRGEHLALDQFQDLRRRRGVFGEPGADARVQQLARALNRDAFVAQPGEAAYVPPVI